MNLSHCASMKNPPKGYGSIEAGLRVMAFRSKRLKHWAKAIGNGLYTEQCFINAERETIAEFGKPF